MLTKLNKISSEVHFTNKWWDYMIDEYTYPTSEIGEYHYVRTTGSTMVIPRVGDKFIMTRQYRYLNSDVSLEFPGGGIKKDLSPEQNALEELEEESGYKTDNLIKLGIFNPFNGVTDEICNIFLADGLIKTFAKPEPSEEFEIVELTFNEINIKIERGELWDGMSLAAWSLYCFSNYNPIREI